MRIRLLACDLDGTLADHDGRISDAAVAALARARAEGVMVVVATGRLPFVIEGFLDRLGVEHEPIIAAQGALVQYRNGLVLRRLLLDADVARRARTLVAPYGAGTAYFSEDALYVDRLVASPEQYEAWFGFRARIEPDAIERLQGHLIKFMAIHPDPEVVPEILETLKRHLGGEADITRSWHWFVEGTSPGADKGAALAWLCERLEISPREVLAIGDGGNDVTMLRWAGASAAPADADPAARAAASWLAPPLAEDPVPAALKHFLGW
ncbi:MAG: HAD family phosphatase [Caldilineae bacterium]|nr:MAG: HAD family phosphatase [Caldilineae bacterium]